MSIKAFPLNQQEYSYNAQDVMKYYAGRNSGVFETGDNLKVSANGGLELRINTGMGWLAKDYVASVAFWNESVEYRMVEAGHDTYDRIDLVVVSWNFIQQEQNPRLVIRKGTPASSPAVPSLVNDSSTIEIALARINVAKGAITLSDRNIVDLRGNDTYCPMVYDEQTIRNAFVNCVGYADGVKKISDFPSTTPTENDKLLIENGGTGKSATIKDVVNTCSLTLEEIQATTDLTGKVADASVSKNIDDRVGYFSYFGDTQLRPTATINGFEANRAYLIIDVHYHRKGSMYLTSCGYGFPLKLNHICGENNLNLISSTDSSITLKTTNDVSSIVILTIGQWS